MPLILQPALSDLSRSEIEEHLSQVRARRLVAAIEYAQSYNEKVSRQEDRLSKKLTSANQRLGKKISALDKNLSDIEKLLITIDALKQDLGLLRETIIDTEEE